MLRLLHLNIERDKHHARVAPLAAAYRDNVPPGHATSLDKSLHRAGDALPDYMVDGLFTTPHYAAQDVRLHVGVSDHAAITATIERVGAGG